MAIFQTEGIGENAIQLIRADGEKQMQDFRNELLEQRKEYLKSHVRFAMEIMVKVYKNAFAPERLKNVYKEQLQNAVDTAFGILKAVNKETSLSTDERQKKLCS